MSRLITYPPTPTLGQDAHGNTIYDITQIEPMDCLLCEALIYPVMSTKTKRIFVGEGGTRHNCPKKNQSGGQA